MRANFVSKALVSSLVIFDTSIFIDKLRTDRRLHSAQFRDLVLAVTIEELRRTRNRGPLTQNSGSPSRTQAMAGAAGRTQKCQDDRRSPRCGLHRDCRYVLPGGTM